jgi:hypothetical protein
LRENERVLSTPARPESAVSIGNVMRFSISSGPSSGATKLIIACLLVISGSASIGRSVA